MKKLLKYLPAHFVLCLILGIILQYYFVFWIFTLLESIVFFSLALLLFFILKQFKIRIGFTILSWGIFVMLGAFVVYAHKPQERSNYYLRSVKQPQLSTVIIDEVLKPSKKYNKYFAEVIQVDDHKTIGRILLNVQKDSLDVSTHPLQISNLLLIKTEFLKINKSLNPGQFNYRVYLEKQGVLRQVFVNKNEYKILINPHFSIYKMAALFRGFVKQSLKKNHFKKEEISVISALLLGERNEVSKELLEDYKKAGAMHILAISGLHIGIILLILSWLLKPLERLKKGPILKTILLVLLLWTFAFIAGLSASIVRAVTMFTFLTIGLALKRKSSVYYALIASLFVLLLCKPMLLFEVGFQLSYTAVFAIVWLQPLLYKIYRFKLFLFDKIWQYFTVSIAAQLGILPLSLYYFHQFPGLFIVTNLVLVPFLGAILFGGILVILLAAFNLLPAFLAVAYGFVISQMNHFVSWVAKQESFLFSDISFSFLLLLVSFLFLVAIARYFEFKSPKKFIALLIAILLLQGAFLYEKIRMNNRDELIVFSQNMYTVVGLRKGKNLLIYTDMDTLLLKKSSLIRSYKTAENFKKRYFITSVPNALQFHKKNILIIDSLGVYQVKHYEQPIVILRQSPKINLQRMIESIHPQKIITDGSNYKSYIKNWQLVSKQYKVPFYNTSDQGALILH